jgi:hypothetical protein
MPVVSVKAKARIVAVFMAITLDVWSFSGPARLDAKQTIAIAVKYPMKSAAIVISTITPRQFCQDAARTGEKLLPRSQQRLAEK